MDLRTCEKKEKSSAEMIIDISPEEFESAVSQAFIKNRKRITVPGFRKGKAPRKIIEKMYGVSFFHSDALETLMPDVFDYAVISSELKVVGRPHITGIDIKEDNTGVEVTLSVDLYPEVTLQEYKGLSAVRPDVEVPDSEIDGEITAIQTRNARIEKVDRPAEDGDVTTIDFEGFIDGEPFEGGKGDNYELTLGSNAFIAGFEDKVQGMAEGDERSIELIFPEDYKEDLAGKPVVFKVKMREVKEKILPELDDEFAKDVSEFDTFGEYRSDISAKIENKKQAEADEAFENAILDHIVDTMDADIPDVMIEQQMDRSMNTFARQLASYGMDPSSYLKMMDISPEVFRENTRAGSIKQLKTRLALEKIAEIENLEVSPEDIENEYQGAAESLGMELDEIKENVAEENLILDLKVRGAAKLIVDSAKPVRQEGDRGTGSKSSKSGAKGGKEAESSKDVKKKKPAARKSAKKEPGEDSQGSGNDESPEE